MRRVVLPAFVAILLIGISGTASAQNEAAAKREYGKGFAALQAGRYGDALAHYRRSYELSPRPRTLFNMALCEELLGQEEAAFEHYTLFVATAEERDAEFVDQARERAARLAQRLAGRLTVTSTPAGAEVRVDGSERAQGRTPVTLSLTPGEHYIQIAAPGADPVERVVTIAPRERSTLSIELELSASIVVIAEPTDATIQRADEPALARGTYRARVEPGTYEFVVSRPGYASERIVVEATGAGSFEQRVRLQPSVTTARLIVRTTGGRLLLDGEPISDSAAQGLTVAAGARALRVEQPGYRSWAERLHLSPGETVEVEVRLTTRKPGWMRWGGYSLGVAGIGAGGTLGVLALRDVTSDAADRHDRGRTRALVADGLFVVGIAAIVTAWRWSREPDSSASIRRSYGGH
jgi:hypothetical protein